MTQTNTSFENLQQTLSRCGEKLATEAINEIRNAINQAVAQAIAAPEVDTLLSPIQTEVEAVHNARPKKPPLAAPQRIARSYLAPCSEAEAELHLIRIRSLAVLN